MFENDDTTEFIKFDTLILNTEPYKYINNKIVIYNYLKSMLYFPNALSIKKRKIKVINHS